MTEITLLQISSIETADLNDGCEFSSAVEHLGLREVYTKRA